jgi:PleD family two-component response regulator
MLKKLKILVIDDDFEKKAPFRRILEKQGFSVTWCQDWNEVKQLFPQIMKKGSMPDIVLVDMNFFPPWNVLGENPAMEGVMIIKKFFQTCETYGIESPPIIGFTSQADYMQKQEMIRAGVTDFITADEFKDRAVLGRRLLQCIQEALETRMLRPPSVQDIQQIEENIVQRALSLNNYSIGGTADFLNWPVEEIKVITHRLQEKGQCHVF